MRLRHAAFPLPMIAESAEALWEMRRHERDERRRERLHLLWLLASGTAADRLSAARQLGRNRETVGRWLGDYARGGLAALLRAPQRPGPPSQGGIGLPAQVREAIRARLACSQGARGYLALWRWRRPSTASPTATHTFTAGCMSISEPRSRWRAKATDKKRGRIGRLP